jgi:hypothetical protein
MDDRGSGQRRENLIQDTWCGAIAARVMEVMLGPTGRNRIASDLKTRGLHETKQVWSRRRMKAPA